MAFRAGLKDPVFRKLSKVAAVCGVVTIGTGLYFESRIRKNIVTSLYFQRSLEILYQNENLIKYLGPPIGIGKVDLGQKDIIATETKAQFQVPITGVHHKGLLHLWASRPSAASDWAVDRLEVSVEDQPGKRILVHQQTQHSFEETSSSGEYSNF